ncbi:hypothetical protein GALMADRAFT_779963 [Galerina marginata CBS 339.88]|uniref:Uncharacterized protein n=1 Tax=Galerina marginata (strain CBS 339.88) TaxID=685588 RepID=A0A067SYE3_GALM3|nr:hypothetical protein GALMADRAFT_779963 [Galerina marginata CBS 339.88]
MTLSSEPRTCFSWLLEMRQEFFALNRLKLPTQPTTMRVLTLSSLTLSCVPIFQENAFGIAFAWLSQVTPTA